MTTTTTVVQAQTTPLTQMFPALPEVENVLTQEQQSKFKAALADGKGVRFALLSVGLSTQHKIRPKTFIQPKTHV